LADLFLCPDEGLSFVVICVDVGIDVLLELFEACEGSAAERLPPARSAAVRASTSEPDDLVKIYRKMPNKRDRGEVIRRAAG
jgi:hypothetical protein